MGTSQSTARLPGTALQPDGRFGALLPGRYYWGARARERLLLGIVFVPERNIEVDLWWNTVTGPPEIRLCLGLYAHSVEFGELSGNGFDHPQFHQRGFGTLVVNTAIQALQSVYAPDTPIEGVLSNTAERRLSLEERARLAQERLAFWTRFGVGFYAAGAPDELHLCGTVGALVSLQAGFVAGQFPRFVPLAAFSPTRPAFTTWRLPEAPGKALAAANVTAPIAVIPRKG
jgi:GNAT superfamily N-acetyltransferase